jgi:hypothetical protein
MWKTILHRPAIRASLCMGLLSAPATATELSPWLGSNDQTPFQLDANTMLAVTAETDALSTGSLATLACVSKGCVQLVKPATNGVVSGGAPQK